MMLHIRRYFENFGDDELTDDEKLDYINDSFLSIIDEYDLIHFQKSPLNLGYIFIREKRSGYTYSDYDSDKYQMKIKVMRFTIYTFDRQYPELKEKISQFKNRVKSILKENVSKKDIHKPKQLDELIGGLKSKYGENFTKSMTTDDIQEIFYLSRVKHKYLNITGMDNVIDVGGGYDNPSYKCYKYDICIEFEVDEF